MANIFKADSTPGSISSQLNMFALVTRSMYGERSTLAIPLMSRIILPNSQSSPGFPRTPVLGLSVISKWVWNTLTFGSDVAWTETSPIVVTL